MVFFTKNIGLDYISKNSDCVLSIVLTIFVKSIWKSNNEFKQDEIIPMLDFIINNIFVLFGGLAFPTDDWYSSGFKLCSATR